MEWPGINQSASATRQPHGICTCISCFIVLGLNLDQKDCRNWSRKDRLTPLELQTMTLKSFDVGEKVVRCHKSEVLSALDLTQILYNLPVRHPLKILSDMDHEPVSFDSLICMLLELAILNPIGGKRTARGDSTSGRCNVTNSLKIPIYCLKAAVRWSPVKLISYLMRFTDIRSLIPSYMCVSFKQKIGSYDICTLPCIV